MKIFAMTYLILWLSFSLFGKDDSLALSSAQLITSGNYDAAIEMLEPRIKQTPTFSDLYNLGIAFAEKKKYRKALGAFESALKIDPSSSKAQANAALVHKKILPESTWNNPFSWTDRMIVAFRPFWIPAILISSLLLSIAIFFNVSKTKIRFLWIKKIWLPASLLLAISLIALNTLNEFHGTHSLAIAKKDYPTLYISPDGVPVKSEMQIPLRVDLKDYSADSIWVSITNSSERFWLKSEDLIIY